MLDDAGFRPGDDLFLYGTEAEAPIVRNAMTALPYLADVLPRQQMSDDAFLAISACGRWA